MHPLAMLQVDPSLTNVQKRVGETPYERDWLIYPLARVRQQILETLNLDDVRDIYPGKL